MSTAFIFPGQGSQSVGMIDQLYKLFPEKCRQFLDTASEPAGFDIWELIHHGPNDKLNQTEYTQVAMLATDVLIFELYRQIFPDSIPHVMAGHSLGEYAALVCAGSMTIEQGIKIVHRRGQLMQEAVPLGKGAMAAIIGLDNETVKYICESASDGENRVSAANYNAPGQVVIAGHTVAVEKAIQTATEQDARMAKLIPVSVPCHCDLLMGASAQFNAFLSEFEFKSPNISVIANVNAQSYIKADDIKPWLTKQLYSPVLWVDSVERMFNEYTLTSVIETGPGNVLSGLVKRINRTLKPQSAHAELLKCQEITHH